MTGQGRRRPQKALSARFVETASEPGKYFDGNGLFLRVAENGSRKWVQRIVIRGKRRELGLGSPPVVTLAKARERALANLRTISDGGDPLAEKRATREELTFREAVAKYGEIKLTEFRSAKHRKQWLSSIERLAFPVLGDMRVRDIEASDILRMLEPHWRERTVTAKKLRGRVEAVLSWATVAGHRTGDNPARWKNNLKELLPAPGKVAKAENQPALALADVSRWWADLQTREGMGARALEFAALTGARSGEVRGATWEEIDLPRRLWIIPASRMQKNDREHRVPLSDDAMKLLKAMPRLGDSPFIFPAQRGGKLSDMTVSAVMRRMHGGDVKAGGKGYLDPQSKRPAVPHGLRSTFRQWAAEQGFPRDMAEIALAHFIGSDVERAYQRSDMVERRRDMMAAWAAFLRGEKVAGGNVVQLGAAG